MNPPRLPLGVPISIQALDSGQLEADLEEINFKNSVWFNREELRRFMDGESLMSIFTICRRRSLRKSGVIIRDGRGQVVRITERALQVFLDGESSGWPSSHLDGSDT